MIYKTPTFINQKGEFFNIGDILCSPKNYYDFRIDENRPDVVVIGGGAFSKLGVPEAKSLNPARSILWAVGRSTAIHKGSGLGIRSSLSRMLNEIDASRTHALASVRDKCWARFGIRFVPCPSVHHSLTSIQPSNKLGIFINANTSVSGFDISKLKIILGNSIDENTILSSNGTNIDAFISDLSKTDRIITNSYHVCYWSLLTGRMVKLIGYSTKFTNLLQIFNISSDNLIAYNRGDGNSLAKSLTAAVRDRKSWLSLRNPDSYKNQFKSINDEFASDIVKKEIFLSILKKEPSY